MEGKGKEIFKKIKWPLLFIGVGVVAIVLRLFMFDFRSGDYNSFLVHWFNTIKREGFVKALGKKIGDYSPAYFYVLSFLTLFPINSLYSIKAVSCAFDIVQAVFVFLCVKELIKNKNIAFIAYCVALFLPTVFLNSGRWAQCDSIYTAFCVMSIYYLLKKKNVAAILLYGVAFSFKLQAIFIAPLFAVLFFKRKIPLWSPLAVFGVYFAFCLPSWLCGRGLWDLLTIYVAQAEEYTSLTLNAPTLPAFFGEVSERVRENLATVCVCVALAVTAFVIWFAARKTEMKRESYVDFGLFFALSIPFLLPHMHERYFYVADILSLVYVFLHPKRIYTAILTQFCSLWVVCNYFAGYTLKFFSLTDIAVIQLINLLLLTWDMVRTYVLKKGGKNKKKSE